MNYIKIEASSLSNGSGWRVVLWVSGCNHCCENCQNPETWDINAGKEYTEEQKQKIMELLNHNYINGLTLSGGDPLHPHNREAILDLVKEVKNTYSDKDIWLYTGYEYEQIQDLAILDYVDYVVDGPYVDSLRDVSLAFKGSSNQRIIDVKKSKAENKIISVEL
ncbi:MAG: anaerobic ribonucleoside-triphosphate reductase activating protein [Erysipelotrichia bacterium]|nr:anaerobic ribonucleoside-triphosphate reductase activating protein [Erysipelotrichia bacterium]